MDEGAINESRLRRGLRRFLLFLFDKGLFRG